MCINKVPIVKIIEPGEISQSKSWRENNRLRISIDVNKNQPVAITTKFKSTVLTR